MKLKRTQESCLRTIKTDLFTLKIDFTDFTESILEELLQEELLVPAIFFGNNLYISNRSKFFKERFGVWKPYDFGSPLLDEEYFHYNDILSRLNSIYSSVVQKDYFLDRDIGKSESQKIKRYDTYVSDILSRVSSLKVVCDSDETVKYKDQKATNFFQYRNNTIYINPSNSFITYWIPKNDKKEAEKLLKIILAHLLIHEACHSIVMCSQPYLLDRDEFLKLTRETTGEQVMSHCLEFKRTNMFLHYMFSLLNKEQIDTIIPAVLDYSFRNAILTRDPYAYERAYMTPLYSRTVDPLGMDRFEEAAEALMTKYVGINIELREKSDKEKRKIEQFNLLASTASRYVSYKDGTFLLEPKTFAEKLDFIENPSDMKIVGTTLVFTAEYNLYIFLEILDKLENTKRKGFTYKEKYPQLAKRIVPKTLIELKKREEEIKELLELFVNTLFNKDYLAIDYGLFYSYAMSLEHGEIDFEDLERSFYSESEDVVYVEVFHKGSKNLFDSDKVTQLFSFYKGFLEGDLTFKTMTETEENIEDVSKTIDTSLQDLYFMKDDRSTYSLQIYSEKKEDSSKRSKAEIEEDRLEFSVNTSTSMLKRFEENIPFYIEMQINKPATNFDGTIHYYTLEQVLSYDGKDEFVLEIVVNKHFSNFDKYIGDTDKIKSIENARPNYASSIETMIFDFPEALEYVDYPICKFGKYSNLLLVPRNEFSSVEYLLSHLKESKKESLSDVFFPNNMQALYVVKNKKTSAFEFLYYNGESLEPVSFSYGWWIIYA